ncbi:carbohydrate ABC transporter permease [Castellaniella sp.]|uniref:carbohydrate ABC transporter permease n=1 Tax=Castellaniella sp. TaxID=1955812 RepID=UPI0025BE03EC|nr:sugar ABC transporter permease [Castellaniella sp.]
MHDAGIEHKPQWRRRVFPYVLILPGLIYIAVTTLVPLVYSFWTSLTFNRATSVRPPHFNGIQNYIDVLSDPSFWNALKVTAIYTGTTVVAEMILGTAIALLLIKLTRGRKLVRLLLIIPFSVPPVVIGLMYLLIMDRSYGILNYLLSLVGMGPVSWLSSPDIAIWSIIGVDLWQWTPFVIISAVAALESMPGDVIDAASIDGASSMQMVRWVILPLIKPVLLVVALTRALTSLKVFDVIFVLTNGGPGSATETLSYMVYVDAFQRFDFGRGAAVSWLLILIAMVVAIPMVRSVLRSDVA